MEKNCINRSLPKFKKLEERYGENVAEAIVKSLTSRKKSDDLQYPTLVEARMFMSRSKAKVTENVSKALNLDKNTPVKGLADMLSGVIHFKYGDYFITRGPQDSPLIQAESNKFILQPNLRIMDSLTEKYPEVFKKIPSKSKKLQKYEIIEPENRIKKNDFSKMTTDSGNKLSEIIDPISWNNLTQEEKDNFLKCN